MFIRGKRLWVRVRDENGKWVSKKTPFMVGQEKEAAQYRKGMQRKVADKKTKLASGKPVTDTVEKFAKVWLEERRKADLDFKNDESRLRIHVLPVLGKMALADVRPRHIADLVKGWRFETKLAQRTVYNIYSVVSALFRDAAIAGEIDSSPCILTDDQLGPLEDADPEWRDGAVFTRDEAETLISDERIPFDRRMVYAFGLLAGMRPGEVSATRWSAYDPSWEPLGKLTVGKAYNSRKNAIKGTKTKAVRKVPVHPTLAAMLAEWKLHGWEAMMGRKPTPEDLILPLPPKAAAARRSREGDACRSNDYSGKLWRDHDMKMLQAEGWRYREPYATKATFITLVIEDGANPEIIRLRVTHAKPRKNAFDGYDRGPHWVETCNEVAKLRLSRQSPAAVTGNLVTFSLHPAESSTDSATNEWRRRESNPRPEMPQIKLLRV